MGSGAILTIVATGIYDDLEASGNAFSEESSGAKCVELLQVKMDV
jgi:hypothetical protein